MRDDRGYHQKMIDSTLSVFIGLFILFALYKNKELSRKDKNGDHNELYIFLIMSLVFNLVLCGLGFLYPARSTIQQTNFLVPVWFFMTAVTVSSNGPIRVISRICWVAFTAYVIMGQSW